MAEIVAQSVKEHWQHLVCDAATSCAYDLDEEIESYLVFALIRFTERSDIASSVIALEYLQSGSETGHQQLNHLRDIGDKCLLFSGLFPQFSRSKAVDIGYYVNIGRSSYDQLGQLLHQGLARLYKKLAEYFVYLTDILHAMRELNGIPVLDQPEKYDFWLKFDSPYSKKSLKELYNVIPFRPKKRA